MISCMCKRCRCTHKPNKRPKEIQFVNASAPFTHALTNEKKRLILLILQCETFPYFNY
jgi:hypothetical protein